MTQGTAHCVRPRRGPARTDQVADLCRSLRVTVEVGCYDVRSAGRRPGPCVRVVRSSSQREPEGQRRRPGCDRDQEKGRQDRSMADVLHREAKDEQDPSHRSPLHSVGTGAVLAAVCHDCRADEGPVAHRDLPVCACRDPLVVGDNDERQAILVQGLEEPQHSRVPALSRLPVGSSANMTAGSLASARAIATRWR